MLYETVIRLYIFETIRRVSRGAYNKYSTYLTHLKVKTRIILYVQRKESKREDKVGVVYPVMYSQANSNVAL